MKKYSPGLETGEVHVCFVQHYWRVEGVGTNLGRTNYSVTGHRSTMKKVYTYKIVINHTYTLQYVVHMSVV